MSINSSKKASFQDYSGQLVESADEVLTAISKPAFSQLSPKATRATQVDDVLLSKLAREEAEERVRRAKFFDSSLFGEPAWDILLDLYVNEVTGLRASVGDVCIAAGGAEATALRMVHRLEAKGLLDRTPDRRDRRRQWVTISSDAYEMMRQYLKERALARCDRPFIYKRPHHPGK